MIFGIVKNNQIPKIEVQQFNSLKQLRFLRLQDNSINSIPDTIFLGLVNLREVDLRRNPIYQIYGQKYLQSLCDSNPYCIVF